MVKTVVGEEIRLKSIEDCLNDSRLSCQAGLVIGKISPSLDRGFVFDLIPTPANDAGDAASWIIDDDDKKKGGSKSKSKSKSKSQSDSSSLLSLIRIGSLSMPVSFPSTSST